jgi:glycosyltransferase involved in cell wall biosynthesis
MKVSIAICTYNPTLPYLIKCIQAIEIAVQNLSFEIEILLIDNNSNNNFLINDFINDLIQKLNIKIVREPQQGLTNARLKAISISTGDYLVFIDDDNVISTDFIANGIRIVEAKPFIGAFSGNVFLKFEEQPKPHLKNYLGLLVQRNLSKDEWSNQYFNNSTMPCGAGLWIKRDVAIYYLELNRNRRRELISDRIGDELSSGGDNDLAMCAIDLGYGIGLFMDISLDHLISKKRVQEKYLMKLNNGIEYSAIILKYVRTGHIPKVSLKNILGSTLRLCFMSNIDRKFSKSTSKGRKRAIEFIKNI